MISNVVKGWTTVCLNLESRHSALACLGDGFAWTKVGGILPKNVRSG